MHDGTPDMLGPRRGARTRKLIRWRDLGEVAMILAGILIGSFPAWWLCLKWGTRP